MVGPSAGGADDARLRVRQEQRPAVGGRHADGEPRPARDHGVGTRTRLARPGLVGHDHVGRMDLIGRQQTVGRNAERRRHAGAVLADLGRRIVGADAAVQTGIDALRYAAVAGEEGVANARELAERAGLQHGHGIQAR
jgi:hypothetical protein